MFIKNQKILRVSIASVLFVSGLMGATAQSPEAPQKPAAKTVKRFGEIVGIKPDKIQEYKRLHADSNPGVRDLLSKYHLQNFSIYLQEIDGKWYEFKYCEYTGKNFKGDMAKMSKEPRIIEWLKKCDPMQIPLKGHKSWAPMEQVYFNK